MKSKSPTDQNNSSNRPGTQLDLSGEVCPYTYVRTKLAIEMLRPGDVLEITVSNLAAKDNVPRAAKFDGHEILSVVETVPGHWAITLCCGPEPE